MGDSLVSTQTLKHLVEGEGLMVAASRVEDPRSYGVLAVDGASIVGLEEKPEEPSSDLANTGFYRVDAASLQATTSLQPSPRGELEFTDVVRQAARDGRATWIEAEQWIDVGNPWQYLAAHEQMLGDALAGLDVGQHDGDGHVEPGVHVRGRLRVEGGAIVKSGTYIEGDVLVRAGATVGPNAYLRGPIEVGPRCKVGAFTEIKNSILLSGAKAPHHNYVGDSVLGHDCNLGSGTKLANVKHSGRTVRVDWNGQVLDTKRRKFGSIIGDGAKTGINASLNPGTILDAGAGVAAGATASGWVANTS